MTLERFTSILKRFDRRLFVHKDSGGWLIRRSELRMIPVILNGQPMRLGFRNRNLSAAHKVMRTLRLGREVLYRLYQADTRRFNTKRWLYEGDKIRTAALDRRLRSRSLEAAIHLRNRSRIISLST